MFITCRKKKQSIVKERRLAKGYTTDKLASMLGIAETYYIQIENGLLPTSHLMASRMGEIFKCDPIEFLKSL